MKCFCWIMRSNRPIAMGGIWGWCPPWTREDARPHPHTHPWCSVLLILPAMASLVLPAASCSAVEQHEELARSSEVLGWAILYTFCSGGDVLCSSYSLRVREASGTTSLPPHHTRCREWPASAVPLIQQQHGGWAGWHRCSESLSACCPQPCLSNSLVLLLPLHCQHAGGSSMNREREGESLLGDVTSDITILGAPLPPEKFLATGLGCSELYIK
ncbi:UNVERIFIED_CONTAM: hypothetical protein K2H54_049850 [Gekko kuhli]